MTRWATLGAPSAHQSFRAPTRPDEASSAHAPVPGKSSALGLPAHVERVLRKTPLSRWAHLAVLLDGESGDAQVMSRGELASWLRANDLGDLASEATSRRVPPTCLLILALGSEGPRFRVLGAPPRAPGVPRGRTSP